MIDLNDLLNRDGSALSTGKIPKKWVWEGDLLLSDGEDAACRVRLHEPFPSSGVLPMFKVLFNEKTSVRLSKTYPMVQRSFFFPCFEVQQWARLVPSEDAPEDACFGGFSGHLQHNTLVSRLEPAHIILELTR